MPSLQNLPYRLRQLLVAVYLQHITIRLQRMRLLQVGGRTLNGQKDQFDGESRCPDLRGRFEAIHEGHADVGNNQVRLQSLCGFDQLHAILRGAYNLVIIYEQAAYFFQHFRLIIRQQNPRLRQVHTPLARPCNESEPDRPEDISLESSARALSRPFVFHQDTYGGSSLRLGFALALTPE